MTGAQAQWRVARSGAFYFQNPSPYMQEIPVQDSENKRNQFGEYMWKAGFTTFRKYFLLSPIWCYSLLFVTIS
jgi:hypothetical protein